MQTKHQRSTALASLLAAALAVGGAVAPGAHASDITAVQPAATTHAHRLFLAPVSGAGQPGPSAADVQSAATLGASYWVQQLRGAIPRFDVAAVQGARASNPCEIIRVDGGVVASVFSDLSNGFAGHGAGNLGSHVLGFLPAACNQNGQERTMSGFDLYDGGTSFLGGLDHHGVVRALGGQIGFLPPVHSVVNGNTVKGVLRVPGYGPGATVVPGYAPGAVDAASLDLVGTLPRSQVEREARGSVTLQPVHASTGIIAATFVEPGSGDAVWVEYRSGTGTDADTFYAKKRHDSQFDAKVSDAELQACEQQHGATAEECDVRRVIAPGVRVYRMNRFQTQDLVLPSGFGSQGALDVGDSLLGPYGRFRVTVMSIEGGKATVDIRVGDDAAEPPPPITPDPTPTPTPTPNPTPDPDPSPDPQPDPSPDPQPEPGPVEPDEPDELEELDQPEQPEQLLTPELEVSAPRATYNQSATVMVKASSTDVVDGRVRVKVAGKKRTATLENGTAHVRLPKKLAVGRHTVKVTYLGTERFERVTTTTKLRVRGTKAKVKGFRTGKRKVAARTFYRDTVRLSHAGVLQRKTARGWVKVRRVPKGASTVRMKTGKAGAKVRYRIVVKDRVSRQGVKTSTLTLRSR